MEVKETKNKIKVVFPPESEIFMAEEFLNMLSAAPINGKDIEADLSGVTSIDTVFLQIVAALCKTASGNGHAAVIKPSDALSKALHTYGLTVEGLTGRNR